ncbi:MAG: DHA2 family efflux MFS transporter permease subunit, partial [Alphaproteobacteria bacterium]
MDETVSHRGLITVCVMLATIMQALDTTIANVALPYMMGSLSATLDQINWVLTSYIVAAAIAIPLTGFMVMRFGRKPVFVVAVSGFTLASVLCGLAASLDQMVLFRLLQGLFGAPLVPLSQSVLLDSYPRERHGSAMAIWGVGVMVGPILGPTLGGWLTENYDWRWVFFINVPIGILTVAGLMKYLTDTPRNIKASFDWTGFIFLALAIGGLQMMLDRGENLDWFSSTEIMIEAGLAALAFYMFIVHMMTSDNPFIDP